MLAPSGLGWCKHGQMGGAEPVSWQEITAFSTSAGLDLEPWEARSLRSMSVAFVEGFFSGTQPLQVSPAFEGTPELDPGVAVERRQISDSMKAALTSMTGRAKGRRTKRIRKPVG